jgi:hypothetical protein
MNIEEEILLNKYGQGLIGLSELTELLSQKNLSERKDFMGGLVDLIMQSKPINEDVKPAIALSGLKPTATPCVLLDAKGISMSTLQKIVSLPEMEVTKAFNLLMQVFKIAYSRRYEAEKGSPHKWWYWDLSDENNVQLIRMM